MWKQTVGPRNGNPHAKRDRCRGINRSLGKWTFHRPAYHSEWHRNHYGRPPCFKTAGNPSASLLGSISMEEPEAIRSRCHVGPATYVPAEHVSNI